MAKYDKTSPKNKKSSGHVSSKHEQNRVDAGTYKIVITEIALIGWSKNELKVGESIDAQVETLGYKDGTVINFDFWETNPNSKDIFRSSMTTKISGNKASVTWTYKQDFLKANVPTGKYATAGVYFNAWTDLEGLMSEIIPVCSDLFIKVVREGGKPIENVEFILEQSTGKVTNHKTDGSGMATVKKIPPRYHKIKFPSSGRILPEGEPISDLNAAPAFRSILAAGGNTHVFMLVELYMYCSHKTNEKRRSAFNADVFEVVPDVTTLSGCKESVVILSRTASALTCNGKALEKKPDEFGMHAFKLECEQDFGNVPDIFSGDFWSGLKNPKDYKISGLPNSLTVKCYRPDLYKLQIQFPSLRKWAGGSKIAESTGDVINDIKNKNVPKFIKERKPTEKKGWTLQKWPKPGSSELPIKLSRNGHDLNIDFLKSLGAVIDLGDKTLKMVETVQKNVPKIGWYFEFEMQLFQGTFVVEWGWKEYQDWRTYYYIGANFDFKILDMKFEVGVGVSGFSFKVQLFVSLKGGVTVSAKISRCSPDGDIEFSVPFGTEIIGNVGARIQAGCFLKLEGTAETGFKIADGFIKFQQNQGWSGECGLKWTGLTLKVNVSGGFGKKGGTEETQEKGKKPERELRETTSKDIWSKEIWGPVDIGKWKWPEETKYTPPIMSADDLHELLVDKLTEGDNIRIKTGRSWGTNDYMSYSDVAKAIEKQIHSRNDIRRDPKALEALCIDIRKLLEEIQSKDTAIIHHKSIQKERFDRFVNGTELGQVFHDAIDPLQEIVNKNTR